MQVLFLVFNRPDTTTKVWEAIRLARPAKLYVAADGPRANRTDDVINTKAVREIIKHVDWPCEVKYLLRDENLGCRQAVSEAITWFFDHEPEGIILEDDCLPDPSFFPFCAALLEKYRNDQRVMMISGDHFGDHVQGDESYCFQAYAYIWGWASWRRAWQHYRSQPDTTTTDTNAWADRLPDPYARKYFNKVVADSNKTTTGTWDYQWTYAILNQNGLVAMPCVNLIENIGFGQAATHTTENTATNGKASQISFPLKHPAVEGIPAHQSQKLFYQSFKSWWALRLFFAKRLIFKR
jgi:hypothetical protein